MQGETEWRLRKELPHQQPSADHITAHGQLQWDKSSCFSKKPSSFYKGFSRPIQDLRPGQVLPALHRRKTEELGIMRSLGSSQPSHGDEDKSSRRVEEILAQN